MHRVDGAGATPEGLFTTGNPILGITATVLTSAWLNAVQEELAGVVEGAGITLEKGTQDQLLTAIIALINDAVTTAVGREVEVLAPSNLTAGDLFIVGDMPGIAKEDALSGANVVMIRLGQQVVPKTIPETWATGDVLYLDTVAGTVGLDGTGAGKKRIGFAPRTANINAQLAVCLFTGEAIPITT